jgi:hypothetical protein
VYPADIHAVGRGPARRVGWRTEILPNLTPAVNEGIVLSDCSDRTGSALASAFFAVCIVAALSRRPQTLPLPLATDSNVVALSCCPGPLDGRIALGIFGLSFLRGGKLAGRSSC